MTLRTCPGVGCDRANQCQRARDHNRQPTAERFPVTPFRVDVRVLFTDGRRAEVREQLCDHFVEWRQQ
jgi:hypothetical protein